MSLVAMVTGGASGIARRSFVTSRMLVIESRCSTSTRKARHESPTKRPSRRQGADALAAGADVTDKPGVEAAFARNEGLVRRIFS